MREYQLKDGGLISASNPKEFIQNLRLSSRFDTSLTNEEYMENFAQRYKIQTGEKIRTCSEEEFFQDLLKTGYIK